MKRTRFGCGIGKPFHSPVMQTISVVLFLCLCSVSNALANRDIPFLWAANNDSPPVDGYRLYYKVGTPPAETDFDIAKHSYNGTDAAGGNPSPIVISNQSTASYILNNLLDNQTYSFVLVSFTGQDESLPTNPIILNPVNVNSPPTASDVVVSTSENVAVSGSASAYDPDHNTISYSIVSNGSNGSASINSVTGSFTYTPNTNFSGNDQVTYRASDGNLASNIATIDITVTSVNAQPSANNLSFTTAENVAYNGSLSGSDPDNDPLTYSIVSQVSRGSVQLNANNGSFTYTPNNGATGQDQFTFRVHDGALYSNTATVSITISSTNVAPTASDSTFGTTINKSYSGNLTANDVNGDNLTYRLVSNGSMGSAAIAQNGTFTYTPATNQVGTDVFSFVANDGRVDSNIGSVTMIVSDQSTSTVTLGNTTGSNHPDTLLDTYTHAFTGINANSDILMAKSWSPTTPPAKVSNTIAIKVDLSDLPQGVRILDAKIFLYQTDTMGDASYDIGAHKLTTDVNINEITAYNASDSISWSPLPPGITENDVPLGLADIEQHEDLQSVSTQSGYKSWSITQMVQDWVDNPTLNNGMLISGTEANSETSRTFASTQAANPAYRPKLVIQYRLKPRIPELILIEEVQ